MIRADAEQIFRVLSNLARNARQAIEASAKPGIIEMTAGEDTDSWWVSVRDDGPGLPAKARENLFTAFQGGARKGGGWLRSGDIGRFGPGPWWPVTVGEIQPRRNCLSFTAAQE